MLVKYFTTVVPKRGKSFDGDLYVKATLHRNIPNMEDTKDYRKDIKAQKARENGRKGGRPAGAKNKPKVADFFTPEEAAAYVESLRQRAKKSDKIAVWLGDQVYGKAIQQVQHSGEVRTLVEVIASLENEDEAET